MVMATKLSRMVAHFECPTSQNHMTLVILWDHVTIILKPLYLHYNSVYGNQTWQDRYLPWRDPIYEVIQRFDQVAWKHHVTNKNHYISTTRVSMATKLGWMVTYLDELLAIKLLESLITWSCEITCQT